MSTNLVAKSAEPVSMFSLVERMATDPSVSIERVEQTFAFYQKVQADQARKAFMSDFVDACSAIGPILKDGYNKQTSSKFATHAALDSVLRPVYTKHGFAPTFNTCDSPKPDHVRVTMTLIHREGFEREYQVDMASDGKGAKGGDVMTKTHAEGSAISYGKRYLLIAAFNLQLLDKKLDNDGNGASAPNISEDQVVELRDIILAKNLSEENFCKYMKVEKLSEIPASKFDGAKTALVKAEAR
jgi:hypothetical protein